MKANLKALAVAWAILVVGTAAAAILDENPPQQCGGLQVQAKQRTQITFKWTAPDGNSYISSDPTVNQTANVGPEANVADPTYSPSPQTCKTYDIRYATTSISPGGGTTWDNAIQVANEPTPTVPGLPQTYTLTGLSANTPYYFAIRALDPSNNVGPIAVISATTLADTVGPAQVTGLGIIDQGDNYLTLTWPAPGDDDGSKVISYDVRYAMGSINAANWGSATPVTGEPDPKAPGQAEFLILHDLTDGTLAFAVVSYDSSGNPSLVSEAAITTLTGRISNDDGNSSTCHQSAAGAGTLLAAALLVAAVLGPRS